jgi:hypothetical protein
MAHLVLMTLAVFLLGTAVVIARLKRVGWMFKHRLIAPVGVALGVVGVMTMATTKYANGWHHLATSHSKTGLFGLLLMLVAPTLGVLILKGRSKLRPVHKIVGAVALLTAIVALVLGYRMVF